MRLVHLHRRREKMSTTLIELISSAYRHLYLVGIDDGQQCMMHRLECSFFFLSSLITVVGLIFNTRAVSRMPLAFIAISTICSLTAGD
jgi:hypothetical protein